MKYFKLENSANQLIPTTYTIAATILQSFATSGLLMVSFS